MPWHLETDAAGCDGVAVVKNDTGKVVGCHPDRKAAQKHLAALYANVEDVMATKEEELEARDGDCADCPDDGDTHFEEQRDVDNSSWDGSAAMSRCANSSTPASCYRAICAGRRSGDPAEQSTWALPHHKTAGGPPNAAGVRNALSRLPQTQGLTNASAARAHLERHMSAINPERSIERQLEQRDLPTSESRLGVSGDGRTLYGYAAVFNEWSTFWTPEYGEIRERWLPGAFTKTIQERGHRVRVLFNHGRDPQIGMKPLGKISVLREDERGLYVEVPLDKTSYNEDLAASIRSGALDGMSTTFLGLDDAWDYETRDGIPERTVREVMLDELGPVTFPAFETTLAAIRARQHRQEAASTESGGADDTSEPSGDGDGADVTPDEEAASTSVERAVMDRLREQMGEDVAVLDELRGEADAAAEQRAASLAAIREELDLDLGVKTGEV